MPSLAGKRGEMLGLHASDIVMHYQRFECPHNITQGTTAFYLNNSMKMIGHHDVRVPLVGALIQSGRHKACPYVGQILPNSANHIPDGFISENISRIPICTNRHKIRATTRIIMPLQTNRSPMMNCRILLMHVHPKFGIYVLSVELTPWSVPLEGEETMARV